MRAPDVLCLDLGGTSLKGGLVRGGKIGKRASVPTDVSRGRRGIEETFLRLLAAFSAEEYGGVALSSAGVIDSEDKRVVAATELLPGYAGFDLGSFFKAHTGKPFECLNDGEAALCGEDYACGPFAGTTAMLTLGTGVGGGLLRGGRAEALPFGHLTLAEGGKRCTCGKRGCIEQYVSGTALKEMLKERGVSCPNGELWTRYEEGDGVVREAVGEWLGLLREACDLVYARYPFDRIILGGGVSDDGKSWFGGLKKSDRYEVRLSALGNDAGIIGAYAHYAARAER